ncbi:MAG: hypothetical protein IPM80_14015 [Proteobacteria bacterium]|nr:hypothetical protein [Pseudomonadota bacterium]
MSNDLPAKDLSYSIDHGSGLLHMRWRGVVSSADVGQFWTRLLDDGDALAIGRHLDDLRDCRFTFSGNEWQELVKGYLVPAPPHARWKAAFVVNSSEMYGVLRQFIAYAGELVEAEIFSDVNSALAWLVRK